MTRFLADTFVMVFSGISQYYFKDYDACRVGESNSLNIVNEKKNLSACLSFALIKHSIWSEVFVYTHIRPAIFFTNSIQNKKKNIMN